MYVPSANLIIVLRQGEIYMCNFMVQEYNRGAVIMGLPDPSGKQRPMVLINDVKPNGIVNYGMTLNAFQISSQCYNRFAVPIRIRWNGTDIRTCFIDTLYTMRFSQQELFSTDVSFVGILPEELMNLCYKSLVTYLSGDYKALEGIETEIRNARIEFLKKYQIVPYIDFRNTSGGITRLKSDGSETEVIRPRDSREMIGCDNNAKDILGKCYNQSAKISQHNGLTHRITIPEDIQKSVVCIDTTDAEDESKEPDAGSEAHEGSPTDDTSITKKTKEKCEDPVCRTSRRKAKRIKTNWVAGKRAQHQSTKALLEFLHAVENLPRATIGTMYGISTNTVYSRKNVVVEELYKRVDTNNVDLSDEDTALLLKWGGGR